MPVLQFVNNESKSGRKIIKTAANGVIKPVVSFVVEEVSDCEWRKPKSVNSDAVRLQCRDIFVSSALRQRKPSDHVSHAPLHQIRVRNTEIHCASPGILPQEGIEIIYDQLLEEA